MRRRIAIDLPVLLQGNIHHVDVPLVHDVLSDCMKLRMLLLRKKTNGDGFQKKEDVLGTSVFGVRGY